MHKPSAITTWGAVSLAALSGLVLPAISGCSGNSTSGTPTERIQGNSSKIGSAGDADFFIVDIEGQRYLYADGFQSAAIEPLSLAAETPITFQATKVGVVKNPGDYYEIDVSGQKFMFVDAYKACALTQIHRASE